MQLTYQEMLNHFGVVYQFPDSGYSNNIHELFNCSQWGHIFPIYNNLDEAKQKLLSRRENIVQKNIESLEYQIKEFHTRSFLNKILYKSFLKHLEQQIKNYQNMSTDNLTIHMLDKDSIYQINVPFIVKKNQEIFLVVSEENVLPVGVYKGHIQQAFYEQEKDHFRFTGLININYDNKDNLFNIRVDNNVFTSTYSNHYLFFTHQEAIEFMKNNIEEKINKLQQLNPNSLMN